MCRLADVLDRPDLLAAIVDIAGQRDEVTAPLAMFMARKALQTGVPDLTARVLETLQSKLPQPALRAFHMEAMRLYLSPIQAVAELRKAPLRELSVQECRILATLLQQAGQAQLAIRLARLAFRRWPADRPLLEALVTLFHRSGEPDAALEFLDHVENEYPGTDTGALRALMLLESGKLHEGLDLIAAREAAGLPGVRQEFHIRATVASGDIAAATDLVERLRGKPDGRARNTGHFRLSSIGSEFEELQLCARAAGRNAPKGPSAEMVQNFVPAARPILYAACDAAPPDVLADESPIEVPRRIFQYWNTPTVPPEMEAIIESWRSHAEYSYQMFHRRDAQEYLREHFGLRHARAFANAKQVVEESDFFRLCSLVKDGGIYADADDQLLSHPDILRAAASRGLGVFLEQFGAIANNIMVAAPGHPAMELAAEMACEALMRRDNDLSWAKTGPGLVSRAVASYILDSDQQHTRRDLTILSEPYWLRKHVNIHVPLPYKSQPNYWNSNDQGPKQKLTDALRAFAGVQAA